MKCGKLTAKLRDAVPVRFYENGREVKRYKNIEIPDTVKELEFQNFKFDVPLNGAITFKIFFDRGGTLKELALFSKRRKHTVRTVLDDISFQVEKGEAIGLIGHNGCGKSTTLKLLTRIMYPDSGTITMRGRVSSLIELGAGFHPDMTGRENIYINASIFGLTKKEIDARLEDAPDNIFHPFVAIVELRLVHRGEGH